MEYIEEATIAFQSHRKIHNLNIKQWIFNWNASLHYLKILKLEVHQKL